MSKLEEKAKHLFEKMRNEKKWVKHDYHIPLTQEFCCEYCGNNTNETIIETRGDGEW